MKYVICDLDGTLANIDHRRHLVDGSGPKDWDTFYDSAGSDSRNEWCIRLLWAMMDAGYLVEFVSARRGKCTKPTLKWLKEECCLDKRYSGKWTLNLVRKDGVHLPDTMLKREWLHARGREFKEKVLFVLDDRARVVKMWREEGLTVLQCDDWEEKQKEAKNGKAV